MPNWDAQHRNNMRKYVVQTEKEYTAFADDVARIAEDPKAKFQKSFKFANNLEIQKKVDKATNGFAAKLLSVVSKGIDTEWKLSDRKNDIQLKATLKVANKLGANGYNPHNAGALKRFLERKENGLALSDRVWKNATGFRDELEKHLQLGLLNGDSADVVSRRIRQNLNEPDKLFRRVRDKNGKLVFSKKALDYHPGRGVYRSSYANARRLVVTETNMAYRRADHERWKNDPAVIGFEIKLSGSHPASDICDHLKGIYPKTFLWTGWHPQCRCYAVPIRLSGQGFDKYIDAILDDKPFDPTSSAEYIDKLPDRFTEWAKNNKDRLEGMAEEGKFPFFVRDNAIMLQREGLISKKLVNSIPNTTEQVVATKPVEIRDTVFVQAKSVREAEEYARTLVGNASYKGVGVEVANQWNESVFYHVQNYPELKEQLKFIGTAQERNSFYIAEKVKEAIEENSRMYQLALKLANGDTEKAKKILETSYRKAVGKMRSDVMAVSYKDPIAGGVSVNANFFKKLDSAMVSLKRDVMSGFHPPGCDTVKAVIDHELGHQLDKLLNLSSNFKILELMKNCDIALDVSRYARTNPAEFIAECWSEYLNNPNPRKIASEVGKIIENEYKKYKK